MRIKSFILMVSILIMSSVQGYSKTIKMAIDERNWYPFTYIDKNTPSGMHVELVEKALASLGYLATIDYLPRKRCLFSMEQGAIDAMISISYSKEVAKNADFPEDAEKSVESQWRIMQVDQVVVTMKSDYEFDGKIESLPEPVRIPSGESMTAYISASGKMIDEAKTDEQNFGKMRRDMNGCVITTTMVAEKIATMPEYAGKINIHAIPLASLSYHLAFSKKTGISFEEKKALWEEIKKWRENYVFMLQLYSQY